MSKDYSGRIYSFGAASGIVAAGLAAASEIFQFRWTGTTHKAAILGVDISAACDTTGFTAGSVIFDLIRSTSWTVAGTGGTTPTMTGTNGQLATARQPSLLGGGAGSIRIASTAALGAGTKTLDSTALATVLAGVSTAAGVEILQGMTSLLPAATIANDDDDVALILAANEGFSIRATVPATGTWKFAIEVLWAELA
jgi:hypothetical protein